MKVGVIGLGKMGSQIAKRLQEHDFEVYGTDADAESRSNLQSHIEVVQYRNVLIEKLGENPIVWVMIPHQFVDDEVNELLDALPSGSTIIEGGNTPYKQAVEQAKRAREKGIAFLDAGVSGGVAGFENGFSIMIGGGQQDYNKVEGIFNALAAPNGYALVGPHGAGHFVKMVHNGIEYGMMQAYAEGFEVIHESEFGEQINLAQLATVWQNGAIIRSYLNELAIDIFETNHELEGVEGVVNSLGEADWMREYAETNDIPVPVTTESIKRRERTREGEVSFGSKLLASLRNAFGGHSLNKTNADKDAESIKNV